MGDAWHQKVSEGEVDRLPEHLHQQWHIARIDDEQQVRLDAAYEFAKDVDQEAHRIRVRDAARTKVAAESALEQPPFDAGLLTELLGRPQEPPHRVEGLIPSEGGTLVVAQRKTGKTTLELNLARALLTGEDFLGRFPVRPVAGRVGLLNYEVSGDQIARWANECCVPPDRLYVVNLRGRRNPFAYAEDRERLADELLGQLVEAVIVDPFGRAYTGKSQNDAGEVGAWLADLDRWARADVGAVDVILSAHAGWNGERTRGASALEDWADSVVTLVRHPDDDQVRFLKAEGRDVLVDEDRLDYDAARRTLRLAGAGSRKSAAKLRRVEDLVDPVVKVVTANPGITGYRLERALRDAGASFQRGDEIKAARLAVERGLLVVEDGPRNSKKYLPASTYPDLPRPTPAGEVLTYPDLPLVVGGGQQGTSGADLPHNDTPPHRATPLPTAPCPGCQRHTTTRNLDEYNGICGTCHRAGRKAS